MAQLGSGAPKCCKCEKTAYSQESISYDNMVYHKRCFRCAKCDSVVSLGKVAMIQGDLYCKNCFIRMFSEKGTYHVFGTKTLPKSMRKSTGTDSPRESSLSADESNSGGRPTTPTTQPRSVSVDIPAAKDDLKTAPRIQITTSPKAKTCVVDDCQNPRVGGKSYCEQHLEQKMRDKDSKSDSVAAELVAAIKARSVATIKDLLHQHGPATCLEQYNRKSILQIAFVDEGSTACGEAMVETLVDYVKDLQADVAMLKDSMDDTAAPAAAVAANSDPAGPSSDPAMPN